MAVVTFFVRMYYAAMRPAEATHLKKSRCRLPESGWGLLNLKGGVETVGKGGPMTALPTRCTH